MDPPVSGGNLYVADIGLDPVLRLDGTTGAFIDMFASTNLTDPFSIAFVVPEPSVLALQGLALAGLGLRARLRARRQH